MAKKKKDPKKPKVHNELEGFEISINEFGEIVTNMGVEKLNEFLDENVEDKKLKGFQSGEPDHDEPFPEDEENEDEEDDWTDIDQ
ncbi:MAG: hypothetical protein AAF502_04710 [Bacteroidota bacterium]